LIFNGRQTNRKLMSTDRRQLLEIEVLDDVDAVPCDQVDVTGECAVELRITAS
jgi:hypothetical protein